MTVFNTAIETHISEIAALDILFRSLIRHFLFSSFPCSRQRAGRRTTTYPNKRGFPVVNFLPPTLSDEAIPRRPSTKPKFLELAVFVDSAAYSKFIDFLGSEAKLTDFVMGYINQVGVFGSFCNNSLFDPPFRKEFTERYIKRKIFHST